MAIVNAKEMLLEATAEKYAVGAFNITNLIQMEAVVEAAVDAKAPLIIQDLQHHVCPGIYHEQYDHAGNEPLRRSCCR